MGKWHKEPLEDLGDNIFANDPFLDDLLAWRHSPEGEQFAQLADALCEMEDVQLDAKQRDLSGLMDNCPILISPFNTSRSNIPTAVTGSRNT